MEDIRCLAVGCVVLRGDEVLLVRHTYGPAIGKILIPGGYLNVNEMPDCAAEREVLEETGVEARVIKLLGIRYKPNEWYTVFLLEHLAGEPREALYLPLEVAATLPDITEFSRLIIKSVLEEKGLQLERKDFCPSSTSPDKYAVFGF